MDTPSLERSALESDMKTLAALIKNQRERPEMKDAGSRELLAEALRVFPSLEKVQPNPVATAQPVPQPPSTASQSSPLPAYAQSAPPEVKLEIEYLIDLALTKGISAAFSQAEKSSAFVQDAFHDALTGRLYPELKKEGIVD
jgi:hypothetical protein